MSTSVRESIDAAPLAARFEQGDPALSVYGDIGADIGSGSNRCVVKIDRNSSLRRNR